ncbi:PaaI family thioesterase [Phenylobacterium aquaticum]|uniref:PaaI family thioesterase n=1 Tax=Phenylobacterium aquaticum TaxID=1763816 RepID=UPI0026ED259D|nr:acyl-CoA thioesterase domain-containing protein [Phenylobacterium aquaticum]
MSDVSPSPQVLTRSLAVPQGAAAAALLIQPVLAQVAGDDAHPVSLSLDYGPALVPGQTVRVEAWVDRATRTIVFAQARVLAPDGALAVQASAVFRRVVPTNPAKEDGT